MKGVIPTDKQIIETLARTFDRFTDLIAIHTTDSRFLYINMPTVKFVGLKTPADCLEKCYEEVKAPIFQNEQAVKYWREQEQQITHDPLKPLTMLETHPKEVKYPYIMKRMSVFNDNNECIGILSHAKFLEVYRPNDFIKGRLPGSLLLSKPDDFFTEKECEIIFFKLQGMTSKAIASIIHRSPRTVENTIQRLYEKAGVTHATDFAEFCEKRNLHRYLPKRLINPERHSFSASVVIEE